MDLLLRSTATSTGFTRYRPLGGEHLVVKFYRPGRWTAEAILEEHDYLWECADSGVAVVPPYELTEGSTLGWFEEIPFAVFPKRRGRDVSFESAEDLKQVGTLVSRLHMTGARHAAENRLVLEPFSMIESVIGRLADGCFPHEVLFRRFTEICDEIAEISAGAFPAEDSFLRLHGDLHRANILQRPDEGLILIDFDDMLNGPPVRTSGCFCRIPLRAVRKRFAPFWRVILFFWNWMNRPLALWSVFVRCVCFTFFRGARCRETISALPRPSRTGGRNGSGAPSLPI